MMRVEQIDYTLFERGMAGLIQQCKIDSRLVVEKETGELIKTLVRISPPADPNKTRSAIEYNIEKRFSALEEKHGKFRDGEPSKKYPGVEWYASTKRYLFGIGQSEDKRKASVAELRDIFLQTRRLGGGKKINRRAYIVQNFVKRNTSQKVAIQKQILTTLTQRKRLAARLKKNVGRLKAGWTAALRDGAIRTSSNFSIPNWVSRHDNANARGRYENWLDTPGYPAFLITNWAKGITGRAASFLGQRAINIRGKAMLQNARLFLSGKKNLADYARFSGTTP